MGCEEFVGHSVRNIHDLVLFDKVEKRNGLGVPPMVTMERTLSRKSSLLKAAIAVRRFELVVFPDKVDFASH